MIKSLITGQLGWTESVAITGATGWLGQETAHLLKKELGGDFGRKVTLVGRKSSSLMVDGTLHPVSSWSEFRSMSGFNLIFHFAALNQDKMQLMGRETFVGQSRNITSDFVKVLENSPNCSVLYSSSGAAQFYEAKLSSDNPYEVYAGLKLENEDILRQIPQIETLTIMRIWNISGKFMPNSSNYALSSFINQALVNSRINILGNSSSLRTYCEAQEMIAGYISIAKLFDRLPIDSGGVVCSMADLAKQVLNYFQLDNDRLSLLGESKSRTNYIPGSSGLWSYLRNEWQSPMPISSQIERVLSGANFSRV